MKHYNSLDELSTEDSALLKARLSELKDKINRIETKI
jgi:hypothetical protein